MIMKVWLFIDFILIITAMIVAVEEEEVNNWKHLHDPLDLDTSICELMDAKHPRDTIQSINNSITQQFLVWGRGSGPRGGLGNDFIFWPAVFVSSLLSGRLPIIDDVSQPPFQVGLICKDQYLDCHIPLLSSLDKTTSMSSSLRDQMVAGTVKEAVTSHTKVLRVTGFHRHSNWWVQNGTLAACVRKILNCTDIVALQKGGRDICVERAAMSLLVGQGPGVGLKSYARSMVSNLKIGIKQDMKGKFDIKQAVRQKIMNYILQQEYRHESESGEEKSNDDDSDTSRLFGTAVHMRFQFPSLEIDGSSSSSSSSSSSHAEIQVETQSEVEEWISTEKYRKLMSLLWNITMSDDTYTSTSTSMGTTRTANSSSDYHLLFITSDSELMKEKMYEATSVNGTILYEKLIPVYLPMHSNLTQMKHFGDVGSEDDRNFLPAVVFDWLMTSQGQQILSFRGVHSNLQSTFSLSAAMYGAPIVFCEKAKHFIYRGKRLVFQRMLAHALDNF